MVLLRKETSPCLLQRKSARFGDSRAEAGLASESSRRARADEGPRRRTMPWTRISVPGQCLMMVVGFVAVVEVSVVGIRLGRQSPEFVL